MCRISEHMSEPYTPKDYRLLYIAIYCYRRYPSSRIKILFYSSFSCEWSGHSLEPLPSNRDHFLRLEWDQLSSDEFTVVIWRSRIKKFPNFGITDCKKYVQIGIILYYIEILAVKFFLSSICIALYFSISWLMYLIPILLHPVLCLRYDKRNGVVVIKLATTEFWLKSSKPLQILDQSRTIISRRSQMPFGYSIPLTMVRLRTSNVHSWTEFLSLIAELRARSAPAG